MTFTYYQTVALLDACKYKIRMIDAGRLNGYSTAANAEDKKRLSEVEIVLQAEVDEQRRKVIERADAK